MDNEVTMIGTPYISSPEVIWRGKAVVGHGTYVGYPVGRGRALKTIVGERVRIGAFCVIEEGVTIEDDVSIDHYCRIGTGTKIGARTKILYGAQIFDDVVIGKRCIIGGELDDRAVLRDDVTYMGAMAHPYRVAGTLEDWDTVIQPSPIIMDGAVIGQNALIVGPVNIGLQAYVAAGEIVRYDIPDRQVLYMSKLYDIESFRGILKARDTFQKD